MLGMLLEQGIAETIPESPQQNSKGHESFALKNPLWKLSGFELDKGSAVHISWSYLIWIPMYFRAETNTTHWDTNI